MEDRVVSFSVPPSDPEAAKLIKEIKEHCKKTGRSFSYLMVNAAKAVHAEIFPAEKETK